MRNNIPSSSSRFGQNFEINKNDRCNYDHNYNQRRRQQFSAAGESIMSYRRPKSIGSYAATYLEEELPPSRYARSASNITTGNNGEYSNLHYTSSGTNSTVTYKHAKTESWVEEHAQYSLTRRPASNRDARSEISVAETAMTNYTASKSDSNTAIVRRRREHQLHGPVRKEKSSNRRRRSNKHHFSKTRQSDFTKHRASTRPTPQIFNQYNPSDESIEEEKIKASIERLEDRLKSKQIMALRRGSSSRLRAAGSNYLEDYRRAPAIMNQNLQQHQSAIAPVVVENHHHHYNYENNSNVTRPLPDFNNSAINSNTAHQPSSLSNMNKLPVAPPRSPGPPPPPPVEYELPHMNSHINFDKNSSAVKKINHYYYQDNGAVGNGQSQYQPPPGLDSQSAVSLSKQPISRYGSKESVKNLQPCHIMQKTNSYASLKQKEKENRLNHHRKRERQNASIRPRSNHHHHHQSSKTPRSTATPRQKNIETENSVHSAATTTTLDGEKLYFGGEKVKVGVLVNQNNLHLLMTPKR